MGKESKKVKKNKVKYQTAEQLEIRNFIIVILVVLLCVGCLYLATRLFVTKDLFDKTKGTDTEETVKGSINYEVAIMGNMLQKADDEYYIAIYDQSDKGKYVADMLSLVFAYTSNEKHLPLYTVDLSNELNKGYYDPENVNVEAQAVKDMKVGDITLLKVKKGKITKYIVDYAKMQKELGVE
jgi:hypothetical protein